MYLSVLFTFCESIIPKTNLKANELLTIDREFFVSGIQFKLKLRGKSTPVEGVNHLADNPRLLVNNAFKTVY